GKRPTAQGVNGIGTCCQLRPPVRETAATMFWNKPWIQAATMFRGLTGLTTTTGSSASSNVQVPGKLTKALTQVPTALGRESSIRGPSVAAGDTVGSARSPARAR